MIASPFNGLNATGGEFATSGMQVAGLAAILSVLYYPRLETNLPWPIEFDWPETGDSSYWEKRPDDCR
jgi:hypothetical protein